MYRVARCSFSKACRVSSASLGLSSTRRSRRPWIVRVPHLRVTGGYPPQSKIERLPLIDRRDSAQVRPPWRWMMRCRWPGRCPYLRTPAPSAAAGRRRTASRRTHVEAGAVVADAEGRWPSYGMLPISMRAGFGSLPRELQALPIRVSRTCLRRLPSAQQSGNSPIWTSTYGPLRAGEVRRGTD